MPASLKLVSRIVYELQDVGQPRMLSACSLFFLSMGGPSWALEPRGLPWDAAGAAITGPGRYRLRSCPGAARFPLNRRATSRYQYERAKRSRGSELHWKRLQSVIG